MVKLAANCRPQPCKKKVLTDLRPGFPEEKEDRFRSCHPSDLNRRLGDMSSGNARRVAGIARNNRDHR
jgi:hypothetical protein